MAVGPGPATSGDIVLVSSLGFTILHGTRDLAVALVDVTQHVARLAEAVKTLLEPHGMPDRSDAIALAPRGGRVDFERVTFAYPHVGRSSTTSTCTSSPASGSA
ncbi:hypothetical protein [Burkholderia mallei]|uniref:hypothetical protein n=1 Tax=Burkholderia mallei TaxID=13373 RepID=UPI003B968E54